MTAFWFKRGFTLIELMIVVAILAILLMIGYPMLQGQVQHAHRVDMQSEMLQMLQRAEAYKAINHEYIGFHTLEASTFPSTEALYQVNIVFTPSADIAFAIAAIPIAGTIQAGDGTIQLNSNGQRCWIKGASSCEPTMTSHWD